MKWEFFIQVLIFYFLLIFSIFVFNLLGLDVNFIISFIFAIMTLAISIFFFIESNKISNLINERILLLSGKVENLWVNQTAVKDLNISSNYNNKGKGRRN